jgi:hypothetical protein
VAETDRDEPQMYQLRAALRGISPLIWRRLLVRSDCTVAQLHDGMIGIDARGVQLERGPPITVGVRRSDKIPQRFTMTAEFQRPPMCSS